MTGKRKRGTAYNLTKTNKRKKRASVPASSPHPHGEIDEEEYYSVRDVVGERRLGRVTQYLIDWEDNPRTGEKYERTWEPKENLTDVALADWEAKKLAEQAAKSPRSSSNTKTHDATPARVPTKRSKVRRVLSSSSAVQSTPISGEDLVTTPVNTERPIEIRESPEASSAGALVHYDGGDSPLFVPQDTDPVVPSQDLAFIAPSAPPSSYQECNTRGSTQVGKLTGLFTSSQSLPSSQQAIDNGARTVIKSRPVPAPTNPSSEALSPDQTFTGRVVPDSQSLLASTSHVSQPQTTILSTNGEEAQNQLIGDLQASVQAPVAESPGPDSNAGNKTPPSRSAFQVHKQPSVPFVERSSDQREPSPRPESPKAALAIQNPTPEQPKEPEQIPPRSSPVPVDNHNLQAAADSETSSPPEYLESIENHTAQAPVPVINHTRDSQNFGSLEAETSCPFDTQIALEQSPPTPARPPAPPHSQPASGNSFLAKILNPAPRSNSLPVQDNSLSSPFPSVPSHTLPDIGESAPPVPLIPSSPTHSSKATPIKNRFIMDRRTPTSEPKQGSMAPRIKAMKAEQAAKRGLTPSASPSQVTPPKPSAVPPRLNAELAAESPAQIGSPEPSRNGGRSPSAVPAALPAKKITQEEMNTSGRYPTLVPQEKENPLLRRQSTITGTASKEAAKGGNYVHSVPMALMGHQRDSYSLMIQQQKDIIERFLNTNQPDEELIVEIETLLDSLRRIVVHPDLYNIETYTQYDAPPITHARWAIDCSSKFYFLKNLIDKLRDKKIDIAIICPPGQLLQILESFLLGFKVSYYRADTGQTAEQDGCALKFAIMTPHEDASQESLSADVVICMDNSAETTGSTLKLLQEATGNELVMMTLAAPGTVEHVERCLSPLLSHQQKLRALVHGIFDLRHEAGKLEHGQLPSIETAKVIADFITNKSGEREWSVAALSMLENLDSQTESDIEPPQGSETVYGEKRPLDSSGFQMAASDTTKRRRLESNGVYPPEQPATINPLDLDISHISDSVPVPSHVPADSSTVDPSDLNETVKRLQSLLLTAQTSLAEHKHDLSELQYRHEDQRNEIVRLNRQKDEAVDMAQKAVTRMTEGNATSSNLRTENRSLKDQIAAMQQTLADHSVPERAEFEKQRIAFEKSQKENQILEKRLKTQQKDLDYAQEMYQNSSSAAQRLGTTNRELENALSHAQNRATGEQARAKQMTLDARSANLIKENKVLKAKIKEQTETLARKDKELSLMKEASRGRMGTRGTSVPRSPRMASPLKQGSRQSSPAAGELRGRTHPLRQG